MLVKLTSKQQAFQQSFFVNANGHCFDEKKAKLLFMKKGFMNESLIIDQQLDNYLDESSFK